MDKLYGVSFKGSKKEYFLASELEVEVGNYVVVETDRGENVGIVSKIIDYNDTVDKGVINRIASMEDMDNYQDNLKDADRALKKCRELVKEKNMDMHIVNAQFNLDRSQLLFNFTADNRVDFRELARALAAIYHTRIELRQIGARDKAKEVGGIGICGQELCCLRFLRKMDTISMNMAKDQGIALNPSKINGSCGRLLCCLAYEDKTYLEEAKKMPKVGDKIQVGDKQGQVISINILAHSCDVLVDGERIKYDCSQK